MNPWINKRGVSASLYTPKQIKLPTRTGNSFQSNYKAVFSPTTTMNNNIKYSNQVDKNGKYYSLQMMQKQILTQTQKQIFVRLVSLLKTMSHAPIDNNNEQPHLAPRAEPAQNTDTNSGLFSHGTPASLPKLSTKDLATCIRTLGLAQDGKEEELIHSLLDLIRTPLPASPNFSEVSQQKKFSRSLLDFLEQLHIPEEETLAPLEETEVFLTSLARAPMIASDEMKQRIFNFLNILSEDEEDENQEFNFDYAEISLDAAT